jgi:hypothetical protein
MSAANLSKYAGLLGFAALTPAYVLRTECVLRTDTGFGTLDIT